ncbi:MAG: ABC transporter permease [Oscillospiraceae bacterium]|nr:ABC transporter permease [Oscillospiraceae bacterium]
MINLLSAGFTRLFKRKTFYVCVTVMVLYGAVGIFDAFSNDAAANLDEIFFEYCALIPVLMAVFCAMFIGTEYSDGTMRNKIITGHKRIVIYMSNFIICAAAGLMMCAAYIIVCLGLGIPMLGLFAGDIGVILVRVGCSLALLLSLTGIFALISLTVRSKAASAVICIILAFVTLIAGVTLYSLLQEPEYWQIYTYEGNYVEIDGDFQTAQFDDDGNEIDISSELKTEDVLNPFYVGGIKRQIYRFIVDFTPGGQAILIIANEVSDPLLLAGYSVLIAVATTAAGLIIFNKKNLN